MPIDKFGRSTIANITQKSVPGPKGVGFDLTVDGHFNVNQKRLTNIAPPIKDTDCVTLNYLKKNYASLSIVKKHIDDVPFEITSDKDIKIKLKKMIVNGKPVMIKRKIKNIANPIDNDDSANRKFVLDITKQKYGDLPFIIKGNGDVEFTTIIKDGVPCKRKLLNLNIDDQHTNVPISKPPPPRPSKQ